MSMKLPVEGFLLMGQWITIDTLPIFTQLIFSLMTSLAFLPATVTSVGIIGGRPSPSSPPFFVLVNKADRFCGGTIVSPESVLTAAHCTYHRHETRWARIDEIRILDANFTEHNWRNSFKVMSIEGFKVHGYYDPLLNGGIGPYDIAVIRLSRKFVIGEYDKAILHPCPWSGFQKRRYRRGTVIGLGLTNQSPDRDPDRLMEVELERDDHCGMHHWHYGVMDLKLQLCYTIPGRASTCSGDSGGPLVMKKGTRAVCVMGIVSFNEYPCLHPEYPSVFTAVSPFKNWIQRQINQNARYF